MDCFLNDSEAISTHQRQRIFELKSNIIAQSSVVKALNALREEEYHLRELIQMDLRQTGIYEAHLRGIRDEEIAHYGDYSVGYVQRCIKSKEAELYSRRTGNAIMIQWPEE